MGAAFGPVLDAESRKGKKYGKYSSFFEHSRFLFSFVRVLVGCGRSWSGLVVAGIFLFDVAHLRGSDSGSHCTPTPFIHRNTKCKSHFKSLKRTWP